MSLFIILKAICVKIVGFVKVAKYNFFYAVTILMLDLEKLSPSRTCIIIKATFYVSVPVISCN